MSSITIITTRTQVLLPNTGDDKSLFSSSNCSIHDASKYVFKNGIKRDEVYQIQDKLIFGIKCLDELEAPKLEEREQFILDVFLFVFDKIDKKVLDSVTEIHLLGHSYDLGIITVSACSLEKPSLLGNPILKDKFQKKLIAGNSNTRLLSGFVSIYFTAFSHTNRVPIYLLLKNRDLYSGISLNLDERLAYLSKSLVLGWMNEQDKIEKVSKPSKQYKEFGFIGYVWDKGDKKDSDSLISIDEKEFFQKSIIWKTLSKAGNAAKMINVVFLPLVAISEQNDLKFYSAIKNALYSSESKYPTIFIGYKDIMNANDELLQSDGFYFSLDRRHRFLDSSIWYRYVPIEGDFWKNLDKVLETIAWAYGNRLYQKNVCREFQEFQTRMVVNSKLEWLGASGHAKKVFPFTFHSESRMEQEGRNTFNLLESAKLKWNLLMVDDFSQTTLRENSSDGEGSSKGEIVQQILGETFPLDINDGQNNDLVPLFNVSETIEDAEKKLFIEKNETAPNTVGIIYDIILLDYLFSNPIDGKEQADPYGTALLDYIQTAARVDGIGVMHSYWIYPISVFNEAIQSHLQEKGYQYMENRWQLSRGADPLNTPHLFRRSLFKFMEAQASKVQFDEKDIWGFLAKEDTFLLKKDEKSETKGLFLDRSKAVVAFRQFTERFSIEEGLPQHSALAESVREKLSKSGVKDLRDHLSQLLYLLGFSVGFDFPIIEQEFKAVKASFQSYKSLNLASQEEIKRIEKSMENLSIAVYSIHGKYY